MERRIFLWIVIGVLFVLALFLMFKAGSVNTETIQTTSNAAKSATSYGGMVGGC